MEEHEAHDVDELRPGWVRARPEHIPRPTYWPAVMAFGVTFALWGLINIWIVSVVGLVIMAIATGGWMVEWRHEQSNESHTDD
jgi:hypothetical protein